MVTHHESAAMAHLELGMREPGYAPMLMEAKDRLRAGQRWSPDFVDAVGRDRWDQWPLHQVDAFACVNALIHTGAYGMVLVSVGATPCADKEREANAAALANIHPSFVAELDMDQHCGDSDGWLYWHDEITVECSTGTSYYSPTGHPGSVMTKRRIPPGSVPLEVGSTLPSRTAIHLAMDGGVARWPYGSELITLFLNLQAHCLAQPVRSPGDLVPA